MCFMFGASKEQVHRALMEQAEHDEEAAALPEEEDWSQD
ncbi:MAG: hypothetical protein QOF58_8339 [Pseudonocardiales bacterium]|jgi:hypothetical protein|nr:hypothetical protein [Pseudonocardiales bacterium]